IAYRNLPSPLRSSSRSPGRPSTPTAATAFSRKSSPPDETLYVETAPSPKFVMNTYRPSGDATAQQISLRPLPTELVTTSAPRPSTRYEDAAAFPFAAPNASVTTSVSPPAKVKPYGVGPADGVACGSPSDPSAATGKTKIAFAPRSVTTTQVPSGVNPTIAGSAAGPSSRRDPGISARPASDRRKPTSEPPRVLSTYTSPSRSAMLFGADPPDATTASASGSASTLRTLISSLPALVTSRLRPSDVSTTDPCDVRCGTPSPRPPVATTTGSANRPAPP